MSLFSMLGNPFLYILLLIIVLGVWLFLHRPSPALSILMFEKVGQPSKNSTLKHQWISVKKLNKTLLSLQKRECTFITPKQLNDSLPPRPVLLAFMGGYRSFYTTVFPLLQKYNIPATLFIAPDLIGTFNSWQDPYEEPWQDLLTLEEVNELKKSSLIYWGALPLGGQNITACSKEQAVFAIKESIYRLEHQLGISPCAWSSYPNLKIASAIQQTIEAHAPLLPFLHADVSHN